VIATDRLIEAVRNDSKIADIVAAYTRIKISVDRRRALKILIILGDEDEEPDYR
jgi:hypothetical protein